MCKVLWAAVLALVLVALAGCGPEQATLRAPGASEDDSAPRQTLLAWHGSLVGGDRQQYLACFAGTEDELVLVLAAFEVVEASEAFHNAVVAAYGEDAWRNFERADGAREWIHPLAAPRPGGGG